MLYALLVAVLVAADQIVKYLVRTYIPLGTSVPFLPGLVELTHWQNTGAAFSILSEHTWLLTLVSAVVAVVIAVVLFKRVFHHPLGPGLQDGLLAQGEVGVLLAQSLIRQIFPDGLLIGGDRAFHKHPDGAVRLDVGGDQVSGANGHAGLS